MYILKKYFIYEYGNGIKGWEHYQGNNKIMSFPVIIKELILSQA